MDTIFERISFGVGRRNSEPVDHPVLDAIRDADFAPQRQLADMSAGCNTSFDATGGHWVYQGNNGSTTDVEIQNAGSGSFDPNKLTNWNQDIRQPFFSANAGTNRNIYAPTVQWDPATSKWIVNFGGWDGSSTPHDQISYLTTSDFLSLSAHTLAIGNGVFNHVNNGSAVRTGTNSWRMIYTTLPNGSSLNKPGYATSTDGKTWTPNAGSTSYLVTMTGYANWTNADVNGANALYYDGTTWHLYFHDFSAGGTAGVLHATSSNGVNFTYQGVVNTEACRVPADMRQFTYSATNYYLMGYHCNSNALYKSVGTSLTSLPTSTGFDVRAAGFYETTMGWVANGNRLYGALHGGTTNPALTDNAMYATWLQKKVTFLSGVGSITHVNNSSNGPDNVRLSLDGSGNVVDGSMAVYDTDASTLLYVSPPVALRAGDMWKYVP